jgi:DNA-binding helix-hairpin-helix protein with protein kinase domain
MSQVFQRTIRKTIRKIIRRAKRRRKSFPHKNIKFKFSSMENSALPYADLYPSFAPF